MDPRDSSLWLESTYGKAPYYSAVGKMFTCMHLALIRKIEVCTTGQSASRSRPRCPRVRPYIFKRIFTTWRRWDFNATMQSPLLRFWVQIVRRNGLPLVGVCPHIAQDRHLTPATSAW
jgi:hypothetical protein